MTSKHAFYRLKRLFSFRQQSSRSKKSTLSPFQTLPDVITKKIIQIILDNSHRLGARDESVKAREKTCRSLYRLSRIWHYAVLEHFYQCALLDFSNPERYGLSFMNLPHKMRIRHDNIAYHQVKALSLYLPFTRTGFDATFLKDLDAKWGNAVVFPCATSLSIVPTRSQMDDDYTYCTLDAEGIGMLTLNIARSAPSIKAIFLGADQNSKLRIGPDFGDLEAGINRLLLIILNAFVPSRIQHYPNEHLVHHKEFSLTSISCYCLESGSELLQLIYNNTLSLKTLLITFEDRSVLRSLVQNDDGEDVVYPRLTSLCVTEQGSNPRIASTSVNSSMDRFPELEYLNWGCNLYFSSDIAFRGSCKTLQRLTIVSERMLYEFSMHYPAFKDGLFTKLRSITIRDAPYTVYIQGANDAEAVYTLFRITRPTTRSIELLMQWIHPFGLFAAIDAYPSAVHGLRRFDYRYAIIDICDVVKIVKLFPTLEYFNCRMIESIEVEQIANGKGYIEKEYLVKYPLSRHFKFFECYTESGTPTALPLLVIVLALICPNFIRVSVSTGPENAIKAIKNVFKATPLKRFKGCVDRIKFE